MKKNKEIKNDSLKDVHGGRAGAYRPHIFRVGIEEPSMGNQASVEPNELKADRAKEGKLHEEFAERIV